MKYKVGIFGSAVQDDDSLRPKLHDLSEALCKQDITLITGASFGIPYIIAAECAKNGKEVVGYSPARDMKEQEEFAPGTDSSLYKTIQFAPKEFDYPLQVRMKYRNVISTAECDAGIIVSGRWGSMNEFTNLYDMGKVIGILTGTGGIADELPELLKKISKKSKAVVLFNNSPEELVQNVLNELSSKTRQNS
jgi:uncharacterized protein (TIGR00725 family)